MTLMVASRTLTTYNGYAPTGAQDALAALERYADPAAVWVQETVDLCRAVNLLNATATQRRYLQAMCRDTLVYENDTFALVHSAVGDSGRLGPKCKQVLATYVTYP